MDSNSKIISASEKLNPEVIENAKKKLVVDEMDNKKYSCADAVRIFDQRQAKELQDKKIKDEEIKKYEQNEEINKVAGNLTTTMDQLFVHEHVVALQKARIQEIQATAEIQPEKPSVIQNKDYQDDVFLKTRTSKGLNETNVDSEKKKPTKEGEGENEDDKNLFSLLDHLAGFLCA